MIRVLIVDDEIQLVDAFKKKLTKERMDVVTASSGHDALLAADKERFDVAVLDIRLPDLDGVELLTRLKAIEPTLEIIMLTGYASVDTAIKSMKVGAYDYLTKPCKTSELVNIITKAYEKKILQEKNMVLEEHLHRIGGHDDFIGDSTAMNKVRSLISLVAPSNTPVLIQGETGTGKELTARAIHDLSTRVGNPFVAINSSALQETMLESELFGYKKGAFTGAHANKVGLLEIAHKGTFFVDEVSDMMLSIQAKILRVLETGTFLKLGDTKETKVDVRFIFATNKDLGREIDAGRFRKDLFFRMNAFTIILPSLREKRDDIPLLANYFLKKFAPSRITKFFSQKAMELLCSYGWPGNVRELANVIERSVLVSTNREEILTSDLPDGLLYFVRSAPNQSASHSPATLPVNLADLEDRHIMDILNSVSGNKSKAARLLGISRKKLYSRMNRITEITHNEKMN